MTAAVAALNEKSDCVAAATGEEERDEDELTEEDSDGGFLISLEAKGEDASCGRHTEEEAGGIGGSSFLEGKAESG